MPVTAKLSQAFYDRLGHPVADEMVDWFNQMDATYRSDLRDFNELNFARFDAKLEQRIAELRTELLLRLGELERKFETKIDIGLATLEAKLERRIGEQSRWLVGIWITVVAAAAALWLRR
jgi:glutathione S-transferase